MSTNETALTCHLVMSDGYSGDASLMHTAADVRARFAMGHATLQIETSLETSCALAPDHMV